MTEPLDPEIKRLRRLSAGDIADEVGTVKAQIADLEARLDCYKAEGIRRELAEAEGKLFRLTFTQPGTRQLIDGVLLRRVMGDPFVDHFTRTAPTDWIMRCSARKAA
jgi:hypothetical protein